MNERVNAQGWVCLQETSVYLSPHYTSTAAAGGHILARKRPLYTRESSPGQARPDQAAPAGSRSRATARKTHVGTHRWL